MRLSSKPIGGKLDTELSMGLDTYWDEGKTKTIQ